MKCQAWGYDAPEKKVSICVLYPWRKSRWLKPTQNLDLSDADVKEIMAKMQVKGDSAVVADSKLMNWDRVSHRRQSIITHIRRKTKQPMLQNMSHLSRFGD